MGGVFLASVIIGCLKTCIINHLPVTIGQLYSVSLLPYLWMFIAAAFFAEYRDKLLPILKNYWWIFIVVLLVQRIWLDWDIDAAYPLIDTLLLFCGLLGFSYQYPQVNLKTDISYAVYIYHMTIVNALIALGCNEQNWTLWFVLLFTCIIAWISTVTIGRLSSMKKKSL